MGNWPVDRWVPIAESTISDSLSLKDALSWARQLSWTRQLSQTRQSSRTRQLSQTRQLSSCRVVHKGHCQLPLPTKLGGAPIRHS